MVSKKKNSSLQQIVTRALATTFKFGLTGGILFYLYKNGLLDWSRVKQVFSNKAVVTATLLILVFTNLIAVFRWFKLLRGQDLKVSFSDTFRLSMIGVFFNTAIPGAVSGDVVKGYYVVRKQPHGRGRIKAFTTLLMDRLLGLSALICVSFGAMLLNLNEILATPSLKHLCGLITLLWVGVVIFYSFVLIDWKLFKKIIQMAERIPGIGGLLSKFFEAVKAYENCRHVIFQGLFVSVIIHCSIIAAFIILSRTLGGFAGVPIDRFFFLVPFGLLITAIPIAPAGLGTGHAAFLGLFQMVGTKAGADLFTAYVTFQIFISLIGGLFYLQSRDTLNAA
ncbi:MAG: lysylphosphatidylglycerol synthase transmembrane domain-containing protein [Bacteriovoracia bacterium]